MVDNFKKQIDVSELLEKIHPIALLIIRDRLNERRYSIPQNFPSQRNSIFYSIYFSHSKQFDAGFFSVDLPHQNLDVFKQCTTFAKYLQSRGLSEVTNSYVVTNQGRKDPFEYVFPRELAEMLEVLSYEHQLDEFKNEIRDLYYGTIPKANVLIFLSVFPRVTEIDKFVKIYSSYNISENARYLFHYLELLSDIVSVSKNFTINTLDFHEIPFTIENEVKFRDSIGQFQKNLVTEFEAKLRTHLAKFAPKQSFELVDESITVDNVPKLRSLVEQIYQITGLPLVIETEDVAQFSGESDDHSFVSVEISKETGEKTSVKLFAQTVEEMQLTLNKIVDGLNRLEKKQDAHNETTTDVLIQIKDDLGDLKKDIPFPSRIEVTKGSKIYPRKETLLIYTCCCHGEKIGEIPIKEWKKWIGVVGFFFKMGINVFIGKTGEAVKDLKDVWQYYGRNGTIPDEKILFTDKEKDMLRNELRKSKFFKDMKYCRECRDWVCKDCWNAEKNRCIKSHE